MNRLSKLGTELLTASRATWDSTRVYQRQASNSAAKTSERLGQLGSLAPNKPTFGLRLRWAGQIFEDPSIDSSKSRSPQRHSASSSGAGSGLVLWPHL